MKWTRISFCLLLILPACGMFFLPPSKVDLAIESEGIKLNQLTSTGGTGDYSALLTVNIKNLGDLPVFQSFHLCAELSRKASPGKTALPIVAPLYFSPPHLPIINVYLDENQNEVVEVIDGQVEYLKVKGPVNSKKDKVVTAFVYFYRPWPNAEYELSVTVDCKNKLYEKNEMNNTAKIGLTIP